MHTHSRSSLGCRCSILRCCPWHGLGLAEKRVGNFLHTGFCSQESRHAYIMICDRPTIAGLKHNFEVVEARRNLSRRLRSTSFRPPGQSEGVVVVPMIVKTDAEWKRLLSPEAFEITLRAGTEYPYTGESWNLHDKCLHRCICCDTACFDSNTKYDSGTGWPSF
jgi:SelR domain